MIAPELLDVLGPSLAAGLEKKGFTSLTPVQEAVLDADLEGRDLRITSQTGSGKTVAIGLALRDLIPKPPEGGAKRGGFEAARPVALVIAPTRELAQQVQAELSWLYAPLKARVVSTTGGTSTRDERRALSYGPAVVVGTPGRMLDHLRSGAIDPSHVAAAVLDEADRLLDLGFREEIEAILAEVPEGRRTHLVSATFPREVRALADSVQNDPVHVEGTRLGEANTDIEHVLHLVEPADKLAAIVNLLLANPEEQMLVFCRTRLDVAMLADDLSHAGFITDSLSGDMDQPARDRALAAFRRGEIRVLVATDVAARGIDVQDIGRVLHADPPGDADAYTHRSGRTGRAGKKGVSSVLVPPEMLGRVARLVARARVAYRFEPIPTADDIRHAAETRLFEELTANDAPSDADASDASDASDAPAPEAIDPDTMALAQRLTDAGEVTRTIARLLLRAQPPALVAARDVTLIEPPKTAVRASRRGGALPPAELAPHTEPPPGRESDRPPADARRQYALFKITWGELHGADARRVLAMACRRGKIDSSDVGAIRIGRVATTIEVAAEVADSFANAAAKPDARDPRIVIRPLEQGAEPKGKPHGKASGKPEKAPRKPQSPPREPAPTPPPPPPWVSDETQEKPSKRGKTAGDAPGKRPWVGGAPRPSKGRPNKGGYSPPKKRRKG